jgi:TolA-binding protein
MWVALVFLDPKRAPESWWRAGQCFEKAGNLDSAKDAYRNLAKDYPDSEEASKAKQRLSELG